MNDDAEFSVLENYGPFMLELGIVDDGDNEVPDFDNAKHAWAVWNEGEIQDDEEKMKSAERRYLSHVGD